MLNFSSLHVTQQLLDYKIIVKYSTYITVRRTVLKYAKQLHSSFLNTKKLQLYTVRNKNVVSYGCLTYNNNNNNRLLAELAQKKIQKSAIRGKMLPLQNQKLSGKIY